MDSYSVRPNEDNDRILNQLELQEKLVEPDPSTKDGLNRNIQLGNISKEDYPFFMHQYQVGLMFHELPPEEGGYYVGNWLGNMINDQLHWAFTAGLSKDAVGRILINSRHNKQIIKDETPQGSLGLIPSKKQV